MIFLATLKKSPITFGIRTLALSVILTFTYSNIYLLPKVIQRANLGFVYDIVIYVDGSGKSYISYASPDAIKAGAMEQDIVLNPEVYTGGYVGTSVTFFVKSPIGNAQTREVTLFRKSNTPNNHISSIFAGLSPYTRMRVQTAILLGATIITGLLSLVAFWLGLDALMAFLFVVSFSQLFAVWFSLKWILLSQVFPAAAIFFLILFPNGKLAPRWSWLLIFLLVPNFVVDFWKAYVASQPHFTTSPILEWFTFINSAQNLIVAFSPTFILIIFWLILYRYRDSFTPIRRKRLNWLIFVLAVIVVPRQLLQLHSIARLFPFPNQGANTFEYSFYMFDVIFFRLNRVIYSVSKTFHSFGVAPTLIFFGFSIYRYLCTFTSVEQKQAKWIIFGLILGETSLLISYMFLAYYYSSFQIDWKHLAIMRMDNQAAPVNFVVSIIDKLIFLEIVLIALSFLLAMLRVRLSDVDTLINRALVYGGLMLTSGIACLLTIAFIDHTLGKLTGNQKAFLVIPISIFFIILIFKSARFRLQKLVDKLYRPEEFEGTES